MTGQAIDVAAAVWRSPTLWQDLAGLCATGGRFAGTPSEARARALLRERLGDVTGAAVTADPVPYDGWTREACALHGPGGRMLRAHTLVWSPPTPPGGLEAEVVDLGRGTAEDFEASAADVRGRIVLVRHEYMFATGHVHRRRKYLWAKERGAVGFLIASPLPGEVLVTGSSGSGAADDIPAAGVTQEAAAALATVHGRRARARLEIAVRRQPATTENLIAEIPGRGPEWVVLSAHLDGHDLGQSAIDNGSGVAVALEVARVLAPVVPSLARGLRVALFTVEEWGLTGSRHYVDALAPAERDRIALDVNLDSVVGSPRLTALTSGFADLDPFLHEASAAVGIPIATFRPLMANSDHYHFARHGIPAFRLVAGFDDPASMMRYLLTPADTLDKVAPGELKTAAMLCAELALRACAASGPIAARRPPLPADGG
jgi:Iap family predicted aminopeptidase